jgi:glycosyltransferase involved in cell wall biosynthesis
MKKRVLILCSSFYPRGTASSHRIAKIAKYLPEFGWEPVVLCPDFNSTNDPWYEDQALADKDPCEVIRVPYRADNRKKINKAWLCVAGRCFGHIAPFRLRRDMERCGELLLKERHFATIIGSSPSMMTLTVACRLSEQFCVPFVPDLRDIPDELSDQLDWSVRRYVRIERLLLNRASAIVTTSVGLADRLASRHSASVHIVYNGFDPDDFATAGHVRNGGTFDLVYCGGLTHGRHPHLLLDALDLMLRGSSHALDGVRVCFYGVLERVLSEIVSGRPCRDLVHNMGRVTHAESIRAQQHATVLLLFSHREGAGPMPSKIFEYLGAGRPILSIPGDIRISDTVLQETHAGQVGRTTEEIAGILNTWLEEWKHTGRVQYKGQGERIQQYTRRNQTGRLAEILDEVVEHIHP